MRYNVLKIITIMSAMLIGMMVTLLMVACPAPGAAGKDGIIGKDADQNAINEAVKKEVDKAVAEAVKKVVFLFPLDFTLKESDFNDGSISITSAVFILSGSSFKPASDTAWTTPLSTSGTALPSGLDLKAKRISSTKIEISFTGTAADHATANNAQGVELNLESLVDTPSTPGIFVTFGFRFIDATLDPIKIYNARDLQKVNEHPTHSFVLANNIDLTGVPWTPIGRATDKEFSGTFDGNDLTIYNLKIGSEKTPEGDYTGLFGKAKGAIIKNLMIDHAGIWGKERVGALIGYASNATITGVSMKSTVGATVTGANYVGGLIGGVSGDGGTVNGYTTGNVSGTDRVVGGLVGLTDRSTVNGYATGDVSGDSKVGGLVGTSQPSFVGPSTRNNIVNGYATGNVSGKDEVGGLVGYVSHTTVNGYATGNVSGDSKVGGLVGQARGGSILVNGYATGNVGKLKLVGFGFSTVKGYVHGVGEDDNALFARARKDTFFKVLTFGTAVGEWTLRGYYEWPAINLPTTPTTVGGASAPKDQPTRTK